MEKFLLFMKNNLNVFLLFLLLIVFAIPLIFRFFIPMNNAKVYLKSEHCNVAAHYGYKNCYISGSVREDIAQNFYIIDADDGKKIYINKTVVSSIEIKN